MRFLSLCLALVAAPAFASEPKIVSASAVQRVGGWTVSVTLRHPDTGWDHYADGWEVRLPDGTLLGTRELAHPHVTEQPFTRSLTGVPIPEGTADVIIHARCNVDGWAVETYTLKLPD